MKLFLNNTWGIRNFSACGENSIHDRQAGQTHITPLLYRNYQFRARTAHMVPQNAENLIDLDKLSSMGSLLKYRPIAPADIKQATGYGYIIAFVIGFLTSIVLIIYGAIIPEDDPIIHRWWFWVGLLVFDVILFPVMAVLRRRVLLREAVNGFLSADPEKLQYWASGKTKTILMDRLFGAAPEPELPTSGLRLCYLAENNKRGYETIVYQFKEYEVFEGPFKGDFAPGANGNEVATTVILRYVNKRMVDGRTVAELPPYPFESISYHHKLLVAGEHAIDESFKCDGKTIEVITKKKTYVVPATAIKEIDVEKRTIKGSPTHWETNLILDPSCGYESIKLDILNMSNREEVDYYLHCVPTIFPPRSFKE